MSVSYPKVRLFVESHLEKNQRVSLVEEQAHYVSRVMRLKSGERVALFNGRDGEWAAEVLDVMKKQVVLGVQERLRDFLPPPDVWVCFAPLKFGRIDYLVQKATELGAAKLIPVMTHYTQSERVNAKRLRGNAVEAAEQCERVEVPEIDEPISLNQLLSSWPQDRTLIVADESGAGEPAHAVLSALKTDKWGILIGPEGGFSDEERRWMQAVKQSVRISLGPRILRADTAAITLLSLTQCWLGDWHIRPHFARGEDSMHG